MAPIRALSQVVLSPLEGEELKALVTGMKSFIHSRAPQQRRENREASTVMYLMKGSVS